jgi:hypothetical protein
MGVNGLTFQGIVIVGEIGQLGRCGGQRRKQGRAGLGNLGRDGGRTNVHSSSECGIGNNLSTHDNEKVCQAEEEDEMKEYED